MCDGFLTFVQSVGKRVVRHCTEKLKAKMVKIEDVEKMKVADLRQELTTRGLPTDGKKQDLVARLKQHLKGKSQTALCGIRSFFFFVCVCAITIEELS